MYQHIYENASLYVGGSHNLTLTPAHINTVLCIIICWMVCDIIISFTINDT